MRSLELNTNLLLHATPISTLVRHTFVTAGRSRPTPASRRSKVRSEHTKHRPLQLYVMPAIVSLCAALFCSQDTTRTPKKITRTLNHWIPALHALWTTLVFWQWTVPPPPKKLPHEVGDHQAPERLRPPRRHVLGLRCGRQLPVLRREGDGRGSWTF